MEQEQKIRRRSYGGGKTEIEGMTHEEVEFFGGVVNGHYWVTVGEDGRMRFAPAREPLPGPAQDGS